MEHEEPFKPLFVPLGPRRMQDTLLDFAQPALKRLPPDYTLEELRAMLGFAAAVWNAVVLRDIHGAFEHLAKKMPRRLLVPPSKEWSAIKRLLTRKHRDFHFDEHFIAAVGVECEDTGLRITAIGVCPDPRCCGQEAQA
jgi:hypothetical protein